MIDGSVILDFKISLKFQEHDDKAWLHMVRHIMVIIGNISDFNGIHQDFTPVADPLVVLVYYENDNTLCYHDYA